MDALLSSLKFHQLHPRSLSQLEGYSMNRKLKDRPTEEPEESDEEELLKEYEWAKEHIPDEVIPAPGREIIKQALGK